MIVLAVVLPGNKVLLPFADLAVSWMFVLARSLTTTDSRHPAIGYTLFLLLACTRTTDLAPLITTAANNVGFDVAGATGAANLVISSICDGANPLTWVITRLKWCARVSWSGIVAVVAIAMAVWNRTRVLKEAKAIPSEVEA